MSTGTIISTNDTANRAGQGTGRHAEGNEREMEEQKIKLSCEWQQDMQPEGQRIEQPKKQQAGKRTRWISTQDELPQIGQEVLAWYWDNRVIIARLVIVDGRTRWMTGASEVDRISHWMPLPERPDKKA